MLLGEMMMIPKNYHRSRRHEAESYAVRIPWHTVNYYNYVDMNMVKCSQYRESIQGNKTHLFSHEELLLLKYGSMQVKIPSQFVCGSHDACLHCVLPGSSHCWAGILFCIQVI